MHAPIGPPRQSSVGPDSRPGPPLDAVPAATSARLPGYHRFRGGQEVGRLRAICRAGVKASPANNWVGLQDDASDAYLSMSSCGFRRIFAAGDIAAAERGEKSVPGVVPAAKQMGRYIGKAKT